MAEKKAAAKPQEAPTNPKDPVLKQKFDFRSLNTLAVVSLASALSGFGWLIAIITGHVALAQIKRSGDNGRSLAITGSVLGYLSVALWIIFITSGVIFRALVISDFPGLQPGEIEWFEFRRGFGGMWDNHGR
ncbi:MAG: DUF4190 domain-containing protein [Aquiluna sp.]